MVVEISLTKEGYGITEGRTEGRTDGTTDRCKPVYPLTVVEISLTKNLERK